MAYRTLDRPPAKPEDFLPVFDMHNHEIRTWSIPCFYFNVEKPIDWHDYHMHDHLGWPDPHHPGHACQALPDYGPYAFSPGSVWNYVDMNKAIPIDLTSEYEGYTGATIALDTVDEDGNTVDVSNIVVNAEIRDTEPWIVDLIFKPNITSFAGKPKEYLFNSYLNMGNDRKDLLLRGKLVILPG
jgi:hypothetical protein